MGNKVIRNIVIGVGLCILAFIFVKPFRYLFYGLGGIFIFAFVIMIFVALYAYKKFSASSVGDLLDSIQKQHEEKEEYVNQNNDVINQIAEYDQNFSYEEFKKLVEKTMPLYLKARNYNENKIDDLRMYSSQAFIEDYTKELEKLKSESKYSYSSVQIKDIALQSVHAEGNNVILKTVVDLRVDVSKYNEKLTLVKRSTATQVYDVYFVKTLEDTSAYQDRDILVNCPNCGAPIDILVEKYCGHCGSAIYKKQNIWVLHNVTQFRNDW